MNFHCCLKNCRISPTKVHRVAALIRGLTVSQAMLRLRYLPHRAARMFEKAVNSALSNAIQHDVRNALDCRIAMATANSGPTLKRMQPHARGVGFAIKKRTSHISVVIQETSN